jgi:hypothetical protein
MGPRDGMNVFGDEKNIFLYREWNHDSSAVQTIA